MAISQKVRINDTNYIIKGGKTLINGTVYRIKKGRTLINGTANNISFVIYPLNKQWVFTSGTSWLCEQSGYYTLELHSYGGMAGHDYAYDDGSGFGLIWNGGGGGGGSGGKVEKIWLDAGTSYTYSIQTTYTKFTVNNIIYQVNKGHDGGNASVVQGHGGSYGEVTNLTNIATNGGDGSFGGGATGYGGSGGSSVNYGNGEGGHSARGGPAIIITLTGY